MKRASWPAEIPSLPLLQEYVETLVEESGIDQKRMMQVSIAMEEVVMNIISHAYAKNLKGTISIEFENHPDWVVIRTIDKGLPFDPLGLPEPDTGLDLMDRPIGGLGVVMIRNFMDRITYQRCKDENILTMVVNKSK